MVTITSARTGKTAYVGESYGEFKSRLSKRKKLEREAQRINSGGGKAGVVTDLSGKSQLIVTSKPSLYQYGEVVGSLADVSIVKSKREAQSRAVERKVSRTAPVSTTRLNVLNQNIQVKKDLPSNVDVIKSFSKVEPVRVGRVEKVRRKLVGITQKERGDLKTQLAGTVGLPVTALARGVVGAGEAIIHPIKFVKGQASFVKEAVTKPRETSQIIFSEFQRDPAGFVAEFYAFNKALGFTGNTIKKSPVGRFVAEERFIASQPKDLRPFVRATLKSSKVQEDIGFIGKKPDKVDFLDVKELDKTTAKALKKTLQETDSVVFGSKAGRVLSGGKTKIPKDVDLATADIGLFNKKFIENLPKSQRKNYVIAKEKIVRVSDGVKILDIKPKERLIPEKSLITGKGRLPISSVKEKIVFFEEGSILPIPKKKKILEVKSFTPTKKLIDVEGIKFVGLGEQTTRKGLGTLQVLLERNPRRAKDPASFIESLEIQSEALKKAKNNVRAKKIDDALKVLKNADFVKLLSKKVPSELEQFRQILKIDANKLKTAQKFRDKQTIDVVRDVREFNFKELKRSEPKKQAGPSKPTPKVESLPESVKKPYIEKPSVLPSKLPSSKLPSIIPLPSVSSLPPTPSIKRSSKTPSIIPKPKPSILPPQISELPKSIIKSSVLPTSTSKLPSRLPSKLPPKSSISKLPIGKTGFKLLSIPKIKKESKLKTSKSFLKKKVSQITLFTPTLIRPSNKKRGVGLKYGEIELFTGLEFR